MKMKRPVCLYMRLGCKENIVKKEQGLSLVELMISIALGLVLMAGVLQMFLSTKTSFLTQQGMSRIQETGRMAMEFIGRDLRVVSQVGCVRSQIPNKQSPNIADPSAINLGGLHKNFNEGLMGYDTPAALTASGVTLATAVGSMVPVNNSNILVIRGATERGFPVSAPNTNNAITVYKSDSSIQNDCIDGLCKDGAAVVSDCDSGRFFTVSSLAEAGQFLTVTHNGDWDITIPANSYVQRPEVFVYPMHTIVYFVAPSPNAAGEPALWQKIDRLPAQELILGIERVRFTYRFNGSYRAASAVAAAEWNSVDAVRVEFVVRGLEDNALESPQTYTFPGDAAATSPGDRRIRQLFSNTFSVRTRNN